MFSKLWRPKKISKFKTNHKPNLLFLIPNLNPTQKHYKLLKSQTLRNQKYPKFDLNTSTIRLTPNVNQAFLNTLSRSPPFGSLIWASKTQNPKHYPHLLLWSPLYGDVVAYKGFRVCQKVLGIWFRSLVWGLGFKVKRDFECNGLWSVQMMGSKGLSH